MLKNVQRIWGVPQAFKPTRPEKHRPVQMPPQPFRGGAVAGSHAGYCCRHEAHHRLEARGLHWGIGGRGGTISAQLPVLRPPTGIVTEVDSKCKPRCERLPRHWSGLVNSEIIWDPRLAGGTLHLHPPCATTPYLCLRPGGELVAKTANDGLPPGIIGQGGGGGEPQVGKKLPMGGGTSLFLTPLANFTSLTTFGDALPSLVICGHSGQFFWGPFGNFFALKATLAICPNLA